MTSITIIGAGEIGRAISFILNKKGLNINLWDKDLGQAPNQKPLSQIIPDSEIIFICAPSWAVREVLNNLLPYLRKQILIVLSKGIEKGTDKTIDLVLEEILRKKKIRFGLLYGPMIAEELMKGLEGAGIVASKNIEVFWKIAEVFKDTPLKIEYSKDTRGVGLCGPLKNIYAIKMGMADALGNGENSEGIIITQATEEMKRILKILKCNSETAYTLAGLGDLVATGSSKYSRNRETGEKLVKGDVLDTNSEGVISLKAIVNLLGPRLNEFPLLLELKQRILDNK